MKMLLLLRAADGAGLEAVMMSCAGRGKVARVSSTTKLITVRTSRYTTYEYDRRVQRYFLTAAVYYYCHAIVFCGQRFRSFRTRIDFLHYYFNFSFIYVLLALKVGQLCSNVTDVIASRNLVKFS